MEIMKNHIRQRAFLFIAALSMLFAIPVFAQSVARNLGVDPATPTFHGSVVDANGKTVGYLLAPDYIVRNVNGVWVGILGGIDKTTGGFSIQLTPNNVAYYFESSYCSGPKYFLAGNLPVSGNIVRTPPPKAQNILFFPGIRTLIIKSLYSPIGAPPCQATGPPPPALRVGPAQSVNIDSWGLVPPFTVK
jgi:hypothetical protein